MRDSVIFRRKDDPCVRQCNIRRVVKLTKLNASYTLTTDPSSDFIFTTLGSDSYRKVLVHHYITIFF